MKPTLLALLALSVPVFAQSTVKDSLAKHWKTSADFTLAVAEAMPAEKYSFKPNPEEMTFGQLMAHIAGANLGACAAASGMPRPTVPAKILEVQKSQGKMDVDKETAVSFMRESFEFCNKAVAGMPTENLDKVLGPANRQMTGFEWLWAYFTHTAHHRGQAEVYLRVNGIKPPDYKF